MHVDSAQLVCSNVGFSYGTRAILRGVTLTVAPGDRIGVVGPNGTGKTTLLRILAGELTPETGTVSTLPDRASVGLLSQQLDERADETIDRFVRRKTGLGAVIAEFDAAVGALATGDDGADDRYDRALARYLATDAATVEQRTAATLAEVGLGDLDASRVTSELSGGQRTRVNLAAMLLASFDVLLLDEPTNDLDLSGLAILEDMILTQPRAIVLVSHDRAFLERVVTSVYELDDHTHGGTRFNGGFDAWQQARDLARRHHYEAYAEYRDKRSELEKRAQVQRLWSTTGARKAKRDTSEKDKFIRAHRVATSEKVASKANQTERALERLDRNEKVEAPWEPWELQLSFQAAARPGDEVAALHEATVALGDFRLGPINATVTSGDRVLITGENGSGKTTLLRCLLGELDVQSGTSRLGPAVRPARLEQSRVLFEGTRSLLRGFVDATGLDDADARSQLAKLGLTSERVKRPASALSPGERTRVSLGLFAATGSNLLVLDEPTNHLDLPAIEQLEAAIEVFPHTVLLVTHDRRLVDAFRATRRWLVDHGLLHEL